MTEITTLPRQEGAMNAKDELEAEPVQVPFASIENPTAVALVQVLASATKQKVQNEPSDVVHKRFRGDILEW